MMRSLLLELWLLGKFPPCCMAAGEEKGGGARAVVEFEDWLDPSRVVSY